MTELCWRRAARTVSLSLSQGHSTEFLRDIVHLRPRTNLIGAVTRVRHHLAQGLRSSLCDEGFFEVSTPVLTSNDCEGAGELFSVTAPKDSRADGDSSSGKFFGKDAYLTVRPVCKGGQAPATASCMPFKCWDFADTMLPCFGVGCWVVDLVRPGLWPVARGSVRDSVVEGVHIRTYIPCGGGLIVDDVMR